MRCVLHCHSLHSPDSSLPLQSIIDTCREYNINCVALTDHNEIAGAIELQKMATDIKVIIGEEVTSKEGHIIGLFLKEKISAGMPIHDTIRAIRDQGGVVLLPHPFDRIRPGSVGLKVLTQVAFEIDFLEIFNARCLLSSDNKKAAAFATEHRLRPYVGSDAHFASEYTNAICDMPNFDTPEGFVKSLSQATFSTRPAGWVIHVRSNYVRHISKRITDPKHRI
ncbi:MAG TPA: PHP domain-containing protein [Patescibacteria group bacterium]